LTFKRLVWFLAKVLAKIFAKVLAKIPAILILAKEIVLWKLLVYWFEVDGCWQQCSG
jgi:hypothetical protein